MKMIWRFLKPKLLHNKKKLFFQLEFNQRFWKTWQILASTWGFFKFNDFNVVVDVAKSQKMICILCHNVQQEEVD
jgi:hypothetical protein